ncbi:hypothetical protein OPV22_006551 [Ensete ventricosum]|uniref:Uncharacterized protein n=1 Tax=Ensete ventricosum TaxID=4639 RepID=A0AAV8RTG3_ENSVE|nr:hypothetical protein OPV22_006551 [Ensete ventricosum]
MDYLGPFNWDKARYVFFCTGLSVKSTRTCRYTHSMQEDDDEDEVSTFHVQLELKGECLMTVDCGFLYDDKPRALIWNDDAKNGDVSLGLELLAGECTKGHQPRDFQGMAFRCHSQDTSQDDSN